MSEYKSLKVADLRKLAIEKGIELPTGYTKKCDLAELLNIDVPKKGVRDPNRPKKPLSPFFRFMNDHRNEYKDSASVIMKKLSKEWKNHKENETKLYKKYVKEYEADMRKHKENMTKYRGELSHPKKPQTPYFIYMDEMRPKYLKKYPQKSLTLITKEIAEKWNNMDSKEKKTFEKKCDPIISKQREEYKEYSEFKKKRFSKLKEEYTSQKIINKIIAKEWNEQH